MELLQLEENMKTILNSSRFVHSIGVEEVSYDLAIIHGYDVTNACIAGILHDCAKYLSEQALLSECIRNHLPISETEIKNPGLLHAKLGSYYANTLYGIEDQEILDAITYHTTGRPCMTLLEKIIFTADYIEPNRRLIPRLQEIRRTAYDDIDLAVYMITKNTLDYLKSTGAIIDDQTEKTCEYYEKLVIH
ncbi:MAG: hypothetical protein K0S47_1389 [Herbinix sp.]|nr:hypothetical protein [Herbinix sp.]